MPEASNLVELLARRAADQPDDRAYVFLSDRGEEVASLTFVDLERRASELAQMISANAEAGDRILLLCTTGLDFIVAFFACLLSGAIPVPMMVPRRSGTGDNSGGIVADCSP